MSRVYDIHHKVDHYGCTVDLLAWTSPAKDSRELIKELIPLKISNWYTYDKFTPNYFFYHQKPQTGIPLLNLPKTDIFVTNLPSVSFR